MSKFLAAVRRLFSKKKEEAGNEQAEKEGAHVPNKYQIVVKAPRQYDEVMLDDNGAAPQIQTDGHSSKRHTNNFQSAPPRAPRQYEDVDIPVGGGIEIGS